jgi:hypothetical protein
VKYDLAPYDARIFYLPAGQTDVSKGQWLPTDVAPPQRPTDLPAGIEITEALKQVDPGPSEASWQDLPEGASVEDVGILDRRYVYYRSGEIAADAGTTGVFVAQLPGQDSFITELNGTQLPEARHGSKVVAQLPPGASGKLFVLYENGGRDNGGNDARCGLYAPTVAFGGIAPKYLAGWKMKLEQGDPTTDTAEKADDSNWGAGRVGGWPYPLHRGETGVFRAHAQLSPSDLKTAQWRLLTGRPRGERQIYINGIELPRISREQRRNQPQDQTDVQPRNQPIVTSYLHEGDNVVAIVVNARREDAGIEGDFEFDPSQTPVAVPMHWQISGQSAGNDAKWWDPALDDSAWNHVAINPSVDPPASASVPANLVWYRMSFALPAADPHVWVPWKVHLEAAGNGFVYLNGHPLGRWWEIGPQTDYYLPECWLNVGPGSKNVLTLCLRPTTGAAAVMKATVLPYADFAESR